MGVERRVVRWELDERKLERTRKSKEGDEVEHKMSGIFKKGGEMSDRG